VIKVCKGVLRLDGFTICHCLMIEGENTAAAVLSWVELRGTRVKNETTSGGIVLIKQMIEGRKIQHIVASNTTKRCHG
jgi:hypothetical protein